MKKTGLLLKIGFVAFAATVISTSSFAQDAAKKAGRKDVPTKNEKVVVHSQVDPKLAGKKATNPNVAGTTQRNCTPKGTAKPYSITRANFNKLPKDRQEFVLSHSDKYSIVD